MWGKIRPMLKSIALAGLGMSAAFCYQTSSAYGAVVTEKISFTATDFLPLGSIGTLLPPVDPISGYFLITFDPTLETPGYVLGGTASVNLPGDGTAYYNFTPPSVSGGGEQMVLMTNYGDPTEDNSIELVITENSQFENGSGSASGTDYSLYDAANKLIGGYYFAFTDPNIPAGSFANQISYTIETVSSPAPEPATWMMMIAGFGMLGAVMRRRAAGASLSFA